MTEDVFVRSEEALLTTDDKSNDGARQRTGSRSVNLSMRPVGAIVPLPCHWRAFVHTVLHLSLDMFGISSLGGLRFDDATISGIK